MADLATGGDWDGEAVNHAIDNFPSAEEMVNQMFKTCEDPGSLARVRFGDGPWTQLPGPQLLAQLEHEQQETLTIDSVVVRSLHE